MSLKAINIAIMTALAMMLLMIYMDFNVSLSLKYECEDLDFLESIGKAKQVLVARRHCDELLFEKEVYQTFMLASVLVLGSGIFARVLYIKKVSGKRVG